MNEEQTGTMYEDISTMEIAREAEGFTVLLGNRAVTLPETTNFEIRLQSPMLVEHLYLGSENGEGYRCKISFLRPRGVRLSNSIPRCYVYID